MARTPDDPAKAQAWLTQDGPEIGLELYVPRGNKGDPGGFTPGTVLATADLNQIVTPGLYKQDNSANVTVLRNYPRDGMSGALKVYDRVAPGAFGSVFQEWIPAVNSAAGVPLFYIRYSYNGHASWTPWRVFASQRVDQTAGRAIYTWDDVNGRDQLVYGDTGWRNIKADLPVDWNGSTSNISIRRLGQQVYLSFDLYPAVANVTPTNQTFWNLPTGFGPHVVGSQADFLAYAETAASAVPVPIITRVNGGALDFLLGVRAPNNVKFIRGHFSWVTNQAWPATLPGTANGTIPNT